MRYLQSRKVKVLLCLQHILGNHGMLYNRIETVFCYDSLTGSRGTHISMAKRTCLAAHLSWKLGSLNIGHVLQHDDCSLRVLVVNGIPSWGPCLRVRICLGKFCQNLPVKIGSQPMKTVRLTEGPSSQPCHPYALHVSQRSGVPVPVLKLQASVSPVSFILTGICWLNVCQSGK